MSELKLSSPCMNTISDSHADCHYRECECFCHNGIPPVCNCHDEIETPQPPSDLAECHNFSGGTFYIRLSDGQSIDRSNVFNLQPMKVVPIHTPDVVVATENDVVISKETARDIRGVANILLALADERVYPVNRKIAKRILSQLSESETGRETFSGTGSLLERAEQNGVFDEPSSAKVEVTLPNPEDELSWLTQIMKFCYEKERPGWGDYLKGLVGKIKSQLSPMQELKEFGAEQSEEGKFGDHLRKILEKEVIGALVFDPDFESVEMNFGQLRKLALIINPAKAGE